MDLEALQAAYLNSLSASFSEKTRASYAQRLQPLFSFFNGSNVTQVSQITPELIGVYVELLKRKQLSTNARYLYLEQIKKFLTFLEAEAYCFVCLAAGIELPKWERKPKLIFTGKQIQTLIQKVNEVEPYLSRARAILGLNLLEKLSTGQIQALTMLDFDFIQEELRLVKTKKMIPLSSQTKTLLKTWLKQRSQLKPQVDYVFIDKSGKQLSLQVISRILKQGLACQLPRISSD